MGKRIKVSDDKAILTDGTIIYDTDLIRKYNEAVYNALLGNKQENNSLFPFVNKSIKGMLDTSRLDLGVKSLDKLKDLVVSTNEYFQQDQADLRDFVEYKIHKTLFPWQRNVLSNMSNKVTLLCGRRSGKSYLESGLAVLHCAEGFDLINGAKKQRACLIMGLTIAKAQDVFWENVKKYIEISKLRCHIDNSKLRIAFENGAIIQLTGNNSKAEREKLRGGDWSMMIIDEAQSQPSLNYLMTDILGPIATGRNSTFVLSGTGAITNVGYWKDITTGEKANQWSHFTATMRDNPSVPKDALETVLESNHWTADNITFRREYLAENVIDTTRIVYPEYHKWESLPDVIDYIAIGIDYGYADSNALVALGKSKNKIYELQSKKFNKADVTTLVAEIKSMWDSLMAKYKIDNKNMICVADNSDQTISAEVYRNHVKIVNAYKVDRIQQIFDLREALRRSDVLVQSKALTDEMEAYVWKYDEETKSVIYETDDDYYHPDALAALRYAYYYLNHRG